MLEAARSGRAAVVQALKTAIEELKAAMFLTGSHNLNELAAQEAVVERPTASWLGLSQDAGGK